ncbi:hypothetical protein INR49_028123 [Caranx melampygus]|nr:hypothetical protein INR49_028123 [Caranx melampygus]
MNSRLCDRHFSEEFFTNLKMYTAGLASYLKLSENAVPSLYTVGASPSVKTATRDVGCQCEIIKSTMVQVNPPGTRLKNKATQVRPLTKTASSCTSRLGGGGCGGDVDVLLLTSTPAKRRRSEGAEDTVTDSPVETDGANVPAMQRDST